MGTVTGKITKVVGQLNSRDGKASNTKVWMNIACGVSTLVIIWYAWNLKLSDWMFILYLATVGGFDIVFKLIAARYGAGAPEQATTTTQTEQTDTTTVVTKCADCSTLKEPVTAKEPAKKEVEEEGE